MYNWNCMQESQMDQTLRRELNLREMNPKYACALAFIVSDKVCIVANFL